MGNSRVIFYSHLMDLTNHLDGTRAELAYADTGETFSRLLHRYSLQIYF